MVMRRGDVYWVRFPSPAGTRPAVLVSRDEAYSIKTRLTVVPVTRTIRGIPTEVRLGPSDGLPRVGAANADEIVTIPRDLLADRITALRASKVQEIDAALRFSLALERKTP
jgi:mRNA interferase MazF